MNCRNRRNRVLAVLAVTPGSLFKLHSMPKHCLYLLLAAFACAGYSPFMSAATLQQFGQSLPSWLALVQRGETVAIMDGGRELARLVPPEEAQTKSKPTAPPVRWPDFAARRRAVFGDMVLPAGTAAALVNVDRGA
jgi:antitoxin (DNA-binding transcriptional repressor) of toxin-antitoxin stability system